MQYCEEFHLRTDLILEHMVLLFKNCSTSEVCFYTREQEQTREKVQQMQILVFETPSR